MRSSKSCGGCFRLVIDVLGIAAQFALGLSPIVDIMSVPATSFKVKAVGAAGHFVLSDSPVFRTRPLAIVAATAFLFVFVLAILTPTPSH